MKQINFEPITLRLEASHRGGGIEISLDSFGYKGEKMTAYQNYLGGGMLARVVNACTITDWESDDKLCEIAEQLRKYFHSITNPNGEWESQVYEQNQQMPTSYPGL